MRRKEATPKQRLAWLSARRRLTDAVNARFVDRCLAARLTTTEVLLARPQSFGFALWMLLVERAPNLEALRAFDPLYDELNDMARIYAAEPELLERLATEYGDRLIADRMRTLEAERQGRLIGGLR